MRQKISSKFCSPKCFRAEKHSDFSFRTSWLLSHISSQCNNASSTGKNFNV